VPSSADLARKARIEGLRALIAEKERTDRARSQKPLARAGSRERGLPGSVEDTPLGPLHRVKQYLQPAYCHGRTPIARALDARPSSLASLALDPTLAEIDPRKMLLLDTETTGLSGGTGTLPFLIGMAWFEDESLVVEQMLLRKPGEETPMLTRLAERLAWADCVVSYNGKAFDWPLLRTRAVMNRVRVPAPRAHLDLLHVARRVFGARIGGARLVTMEEEVLGMRRERDVDGAEIPTLFWEFVRGAEGSILAPVIEHNANDLIALAGLMAVLEERWSAPSPSHPPEDRLSLARVAMRSGETERAQQLALAVIDEEPPHRIAFEALRLSAELARKHRDAEGESALLARALDHVAEHDPRKAETHLRLAICLEHRVKSPERALAHAEKAGDEGAARRERLLAKIARREEKSLAARAKRKRRQGTASSAGGVASPAGAKNAATRRSAS
jgi:uncharacterized protein YprB with RNaseH-like and TPR domain